MKNPFTIEEVPRPDGKMTYDEWFDRREWNHCQERKAAGKHLGWLNELVGAWTPSRETIEQWQREYEEYLRTGVI